MIVLLMGPPSCGKTTQAAHIMEQHGLPALDFAQVLAAATATPKSGAAVEAKGLIATGERLPEALAIEILKERLDEGDCAKGFSLEGIPVNMEQAALLDGMLARKGLGVDAAIYLDVQDQEWHDLYEPLLGWYMSSGKLATLNSNMYLDEVKECVSDILKAAHAAAALPP
eukprot:CAMPEP_0173420320 /NCGR_PEP_ID=MMETSP1357-20121228/1860_1 /TAXON_ID=77926 /ORGANISM="Hemiselmis rufescens, Strain PCC563" /LENGTH=169 /DNA_ID=CAMNT_0014383099 /DNA_START=56 /DNA_END=562 /DNA_ORIENTATION=+